VTPIIKLLGPNDSDTCDNHQVDDEGMVL